MTARIIKSVFDALNANAGITAAVPLYRAAPNIHSGEAPADAPYPYITVGPIIADTRGAYATKDTKARFIMLDITILGRFEQAVDVEQLAIAVRDLFDSGNLVIVGANDSPLVNADGPVEKPSSKEYQGYVVTVKVDYES